MTRTWIEPAAISVPSEFAAAIGGHPLLAEMLVRRGIQDIDTARRFLQPEFYAPAPADDLPDMSHGVERVAAAIAQHELIAVWGDFDVDGQTSTALLVSALEALGGRVIYYIPNREKEGHGVHIPRLSELLQRGVQLVITCDTGIAAHAAVDFANRQSVDVVITDHHQLPPELPHAYAAINPQRLPVGHPLRTLPGVGCAYKLVEALYNRAGRADELAQFLDLVALGIVADVAEVAGDTRYLLQRGLRALRQTRRLGLVMMIESAGLVQANIDEGHIGFSLAPRLNALGRLDDANAAVELLTTDRLERARILVNRLEGLNAQRKLISDQIYQAARKQIERDSNLLHHAVLVLSHETWHGGVLGLVANRLAEQYNRPVILLTTPPDDFARGSARSVAGLDITAAIAAHADLLNSYGGHTMAAGLSLLPDKIPDFRRAISSTVKTMLGVVDTTPTLTVDAYLSLADLQPGLLEALDLLAPFGPGNPAPILATRRLTLHAQRQIGRSGEHLRLSVVDEAGIVQDMLWWRAEAEDLPRGRFDAAYTVQANEYQGRRELQLVLADVRPVDETPLEFSQRSAIEIVDYRDVPDQVAKIVQLGDVLIWAEGKNRPPGSSVTRHELVRAPTLVIWTAPPGAEELRRALETVNPGKIYLFGVSPGTDAMQAFLQFFGGIVKHVLNNQQGKTTLPALAAAVGHRTATVRAGLKWLAARGSIEVIQQEDEAVWIRTSETPSGDNPNQTTAQLAALLQETTAYRAYFRQTDPNRLILT